MPAVYATLTDVYRLGLTARAFATAARGLLDRAGDSFDYATGTFRLNAHGFEADDLIQFVLPGAGAIPTGAALATPYHPLKLDFYRFRLSLTQGGAAVTFSTAGNGWTLQLDPEARISAHLLQACADIDQDLTAQAPPLKVDPVTGRYPQVVIGMVARTAARSAVTSLQIENADYRVAVDRLFAQEKIDEAQRDAWRKGQPISPRPTDQDGVATDGAIAGFGRPSAGWNTAVL